MSPSETDGENTAGEAAPDPRAAYAQRLDGGAAEARASTLPEPSDPQISPRRAVFALAVVLLLALGGLLTLRHTDAKGGGIEKGASWFAPYVDATLPPTYPFEEPDADPSREIVLGFVVAAPSSSCQPSWGGFYSLAGADSSLQLDRRIVQLRGDGGEAIVSFGGEAGTELAVACESEPKLAAAYRQVIERYKLRTIDLDVEGAALGNAAASERRAQAIAALQRQKSVAGGHLAVWLTLPVAPTGLEPDAIAVVEAMLAGHVRLAGVNAMTMDFGSAGKPDSDPLRSSEQALRALDGQLQASYRRAGTSLDAAAAWRKIGATPMIGHNDVAGEVFTLADARKLTAFARTEHMARLSMWSLNRDEQCSAASVEASTASNTCSGVQQRPLAFSRIFGALRGSASKASVNAAEPIPGTVQSSSQSAADSPYPIWKSTLAYPAGYKVVWDDDVYETRWFSQGQTPGAQAEHGQESPWLLIGPVLPDEHPPQIPQPKPGTYSKWSGQAVYRTGDRVLFDGLPYVARWYSHDEPPPSEPEGSQTTPWNPLYKIPGEPSLGDG